MGLPLLFSATLGVGAALLFCVQPMIARMVLPQLGGAPAVWNTCMVFFQAALLAGYACAHASTARLGHRGQAALHTGLIAAALVALPVAIGPDAAGTLTAGSAPAPWLLAVLMKAVGLPFFVVATTAPLLQRWFARTGHPAAADPYFLYAASNAGSMLALLAYPLAIEPTLTLAAQSRYWSVGYGLLAVLTIACAAASRRPSAMETPPDEGAARPGVGRWVRWAALGFVPSSLMLGVTTFLTTEIAAIPLLWVVPLAIYLLTFILVFARRPPVSHERMLRLLPLLATCLVVVIGLGATQPGWIGLHLLTFFVAAMACHGELARLRPPVRDLTAFYLAMAAGGVLGGAFNALIAPVLFDRVAEYPLALILACLASPTRRRSLGVAWPMAVGLATVVLAAASPSGPAPRPGEFGAKFVLGLAAFACYALAARPIRFAAAIGAVLAIGGLSTGKGGPVVYRSRSFFGVLKVVRVQTPDGEARQLVHGRTLHGEQRLAPGLRCEPLTYFTRSGPCGDVFAAYRSRPAAPGVAIVGLGAGSLACYAEPGQRWTFFEIDPDVARVAADPRYFTFLRDCRAGPPAVVMGDARLRLRDAPDRGYGLIVMDAFSGDAVPVHLLTREALRLYRAKLAPGGLIAVQITNHSIDFAPVLAAQAADAGMSCRIRSHWDIAPADARRGTYPSRWAVLADHKSDLGPLSADPRWVAPPARPGQGVWRDDFSNLVEDFWIWERFKGPGPKPEGKRIDHKDTKGTKEE